MEQTIAEDEKELIKLVKEIPDVQVNLIEYECYGEKKTKETELP